MNLRKSIILLTSFVAQNIWQTKNGEIYVNNTIPYRIRGVNWHGIETNCKVPHGLWLNKVSFYLDILKQVEQVEHPFFKLTLQNENKK